MKTNQVLVRKMGDFEVSQRTSDGYFDGNALLNQWNKSNLKNSKRRRQMSEFKESPNTYEFIESLREDILNHDRKNVHADFQAIKEIKGRMTKKGKTSDQIWMHPYLFIKFAMWINPRFEVKVIKFVYDELVRYRNDAGDAYKEMASSVSLVVSKLEMPTAMQKIAKAINIVIYGEHQSGMRNKVGEENKARELLDLERDISKCIKHGFLKSFEDIMSFLRKEYQQRYLKPKELYA